MMDALALFTEKSLAGEYYSTVRTRVDGALHSAAKRVLHHLGVSPNDYGRIDEVRLVTKSKDVQHVVIIYSWGSKELPVQTFNMLAELEDV